MNLKDILEIYWYQYVSVKFKPCSYMNPARSSEDPLSLVTLVSRLVDTQPS